MKDKVKVGIVGSAGYTGGELLRVLIRHTHVEIMFAHSVSNAGNKVYAVHNDLFGDTELVFSAEFHSDVDILFLCVGHGDARKFLESNKARIRPEVKIIDLSQDYRLKGHTSFLGHDFVYGLPELNREAIETAHYIANPGCFATNLQLALLPLAAEGLLPDHIHVHAITGSTGAGQKPGPTSHFSWRNNNISAYKVFTHQHLQEVSQSLEQLQPGFLPQPTDTTEADLLERAAEKISFVPQRGDFPRGIFSSVTLKCDLSEAQAFDLYTNYYATHPFTHVSEVNIDLKQVVNTNKSLLHLVKKGQHLLILNATDNLLKGASGQAVQNMNLLFGMDEMSGLRLKSIGY